MSNSYLLNVVVAKSTTILKLLSGEDQTLLVGGNALLVLDLGLDIVDGVGGLDLKGDGLAREGLDETANKNTPSVYLHVLFPRLWLFMAIFLFVGARQDFE